MFKHYRSTSEKKLQHAVCQENCPEDPLPSSFSCAFAHKTFAESLAELCRQSAARGQLLNLDREKEDSRETALVGKEECRTENQKTGPLEVRMNKHQCQG